MDQKDLELNFMVITHRQLLLSIENRLLAGHLGKVDVVIAGLIADIVRARTMSFTVTRAMGTRYVDMAEVLLISNARCRELAVKGARMFRRHGWDHPLFPNPVSNFHLEIKPSECTKNHLQTLVELLTLCDELTKAAKSLKTIQLSKVSK